MKTAVMVLAFLLCLSSCRKVDNEGNKESEKELAFDSEKWKIKVGWDYPYRDRMLGNLIDSDTLKKLQKDQIIEMLGAPQRIENNHLYYPISQERWGLLTLRVKTMVVKMRDDDVVEWVKIHQ